MSHKRSRESSTQPHSITAEELERVQKHIEDNKKPQQETDYIQVDGYDHLTVFQGLEGDKSGYMVQYEDNSLNIDYNRVNLINLSKFLDKYNQHQDFDRAYREQYETSGSKAEEFRPIIENTEEDLTQDLSKLAEDLDPR